MEQPSKWHFFLKELANLVFFWFVGILFFLVHRAVFIWLYKEQVGPTADSGDFAKTFFMGFRFDATVMAYFIFLPFLLLLVLSGFGKFKAAEKTRIVCQHLFAVLSTLVCIITYNYFREYNDQFNNFLFLWLYDDKNAVMKTVIQYFHPVLNSVAILCTVVVMVVIFKKFEKGRRIYGFLKKFQARPARIAIVALSLFLFVSSIRGSFTKVPAIKKWAAVSKDSFLNKTILNPYRAFIYALNEFNDLNLIDGKNPFLAKGDLQSVYPGHNLVTELLEKQTAGHNIEKPKQIFLVVMESYDSWPLMDKYAPFKFSENLKKIADKGTHYTNFLPSGHATFYSFAAVVTGVPYTGVNISHVGTLNEPFQTSMLKQFKKLGYETNFFYGGFLSWENIGDFMRYQGADHVYSGVDAGGKSDSGDWGIEDEKLFDLVLKNVNPEKYTVNVILTSSYHPPYAIDIYKKGFPYKTPADFPESVRKYYDDGMTFQEMGHLWYGDKAIGEFMAKAEKKYATGIFGFTGDHYGRRFINHSPDLYERSSVPFILYGKNIPVGVNTTPGSHIDILPTLIELVAPKGFKYYSFGSDLQQSGKTDGIGLYKAIDRTTLEHFEKDMQPETFDLQTRKESKAKTAKYKPEHDRLMSLAWHYTMRGNSLADTLYNKKDKPK